MRDLTTNKDLRKLIEEATIAGFIVSKRRNGHLKWTAPSGNPYYSSATPSDYRAIRNISAWVRNESP